MKSTDTIFAIFKAVFMGFKKIIIHFAELEKR